jgi:putative ABC transport system substrate-binding protein
MRPVWHSLGYVEGETVLLRAAEYDLRRLPELVAELISLNVGVLIVTGPAAVRAAAQVTKTTPIVAIDLETNPIRAGVVASFNRPGGNVTGLFMDQASLAGKWVELLREAAPWIERVGLVWDPGSVQDQRDAAIVAARTKRIEAPVLEVHTTEGFEAAFRGLGGEHRTGVVLLGSPDLTRPLARFGDAALKLRLPNISFYPPHAKAGALMAYGPNIQDYFPRAAILADKILKGAKPGELPIEQPAVFEFVINLKTAKALGLTVPLIMQMSADEVIE